MILFFVLFFFVPFLVNAQTFSPVVINEIAWMGSSSVDGIDANQHWRYEWLELRSTVERSTVLDGWSIELYQPSTAKATEDKGELYFTIPVFGSISASGYFLIGASDKIPNADVDYANLGGKLLNTGMMVMLKDELGNVIDEVDAREGWQAGGNETKRTMERKEGSDPPLWHTSAMFGGTPKAKNSEGLKELVLNLSSFETKKDLMGSSQDSLHIFNGTTLLAVLLALGSSVGILGLRRYLARRA